MLLKILLILKHFSATSTLDPTSEKKVQDALDKAARGRTTIFVPHRLSSARNVNKIVYMEKGKFLEQGTHDALMEKKGHYYKFVMSNHSHGNTKQSHQCPGLIHSFSHMSLIAESDSDSEHEADELDLNEATRLLSRSRKPKNKNVFLRFVWSLEIF